LHQWGLRVTAVSSAVEAVDLIRDGTHQFNIALLDHRLSGARMQLLFWWALSRPAWIEATDFGVW
jgi:CheY-like chemotaxis protein